MPMMSSAASVQSTARRFGAYDRTTSLPNESGISMVYRFHIFDLPRVKRQKPLYEAKPLKTGALGYRPPVRLVPREAGAHVIIYSHAQWNAHALVEGIARHFSCNLVRRPVLFAAAPRLSRGREGFDQHAAFRNHGAAPVRPHDHRRRGQHFFWARDADRISAVPTDDMAQDQIAAGGRGHCLPLLLLQAHARLCRAAQSAQRQVAAGIQRGALAALDRHRDSRRGQAGSLTPKGRGRIDPGKSCAKRLTSLDFWPPF